jgi:ribosomal protein L7Ae-like RNA K-turn-binding protein
MDNDFLGFIGLATKAGRLSSGHDASFDAIRTGKAKLILLTADASDRLKKEFQESAVYGGRNIRCITIPYSINDIRDATGKKAAVLTVNEERFADRIADMLRGGTKE